MNKKPYATCSVRRRSAFFTFASPLSPLNASTFVWLSKSSLLASFSRRTSNGLRASWCFVKVTKLVNHRVIHAKIPRAFAMETSISVEDFLRSFSSFSSFCSFSCFSFLKSLSSSSFASLSQDSIMYLFFRTSLLENRTHAKCTRMPTGYKKKLITATGARR